MYPTETLPVVSQQLIPTSQQDNENTSQQDNENTSQQDDENNSQQDDENISQLDNLLLPLNLQEVDNERAQPENIDMELQLGHTMPGAGVVSGKFPHTQTHNMGQSVDQYVTRLPKLTLPSFSGNPLELVFFGGEQVW